MSETHLKYGSLDTAFRRRSHNIFKDILKTFAAEPYPAILDVGCASGIIGQLKGSPKNIFGIERDPALARVARQHCEKVYELDLNRLRRDDMEEKDFDFIFCGDIIEHVLDPLRLLAIFKGLLKDKGYLIVSVPNVAQLPIRLGVLFGRFDRTETGILDKTHLHFFTFKTAAELLTLAGLKIDKTYPSGTIVSFIPFFPNLLAAQFVFLCRKG